MSATTAVTRHGTLASWAVGLASGLVLVLTPATVVLLLPALVPSLLVRVLDESPDRSVFRPVLVCNLAAVLGPTVRLWSGGPPELSRALTMLSEPKVLCSAWLAASAAWMASEMVTMVALRVLVLRDARAESQLTAEIDRLRAEWGDETDRPEP